MKAAVQEKYGLPEVVRVGDVDRPVPADGQVLVRVRAASVNRADLDGLGELIAAGEVKPVIDRRFPLSEVVAALRWVDDGRARGKVIVTP